MTNSDRREMKFGVILEGAGTTAHGWTRPTVQPNASVDIAHYVEAARRFEEAGMDFVFIADTLHINAASAPHLLNRLEPLTLLSAVATATSRIGLVATVSTLFGDPFTAARQLASLDLISGGRAAWNVVTSAVPAAALNHSRPLDFGQGDRYDRALEHVRVVQGLWDSWEDDAFPYDESARLFHDPDRMHALDHEGRYFQVKGPLNIQRSRQGHPVLFQAGGSDDGRAFAARVADAIFAMTSNHDAAIEYARDVRTRAAGFGRDPSAIIFLPRITPIIGRSSAEAEDRYRALASLASVDDAVAVFGLYLGADLTRHALDMPFASIDIGTMQAEIDQAGPDRLAYIEAPHPDLYRADAIERGLTLREAALQFLTPRTAFVGTLETVAGECERWFLGGAADGFIIRAGDCDAFVDEGLPFLQERGLFRAEYDADTLRGHLGLPAVANRYAMERVSETERRDVMPS